MTGESSEPRKRGQGFVSVAALAVALGGSAVLYQKSRAVDFDAHARVVAAAGEVRQQAEALSKQALAARFGLLNHYDPIVRAEGGLSRAELELEQRLTAVVGTDPELSREMGELSAAISRQSRIVERFKGENSILKNSLYYLPSITRELVLNLGSEHREALLAIQRMSNAALVYNLVGDKSAAGAHAEALANLEPHLKDVPEGQKGQLGILIAHARVIGQKQPEVDRDLKGVVDSDLLSHLQSVERVYDQRFSAMVASSNVYRKILYGWSLLLLVTVVVVGLQLRRLYADLERRVAERTAELRNALSALWGEMRLARKIQEALVPAQPSLSGCEVAACMKATDEVGGDYYDVVQTPTAEWILIGDVSGHGVPAGLVMMMCHTAVRTVIKADPKVMPHDLLARVNVVLSENIRQLGENKYMTISALRRNTDGTIHFAGAHQDILVYRAASDSIETRETHGIWLGLKPDIASSLSTKSFQLTRGDILLLYTDGVTEAALGGSLFDGTGIKSVLSRARGKSAQEVLESVFSALQGFEVKDDATVLVIRQLESASSARPVHPSASAMPEA